MAFKMRNSLIQGSRLHKEHKLKVQREGYANMKDGRANSSAFQQGTVVKDNKVGVDYSATAKVDVPDKNLPSTRFKQEGESGPMTQKEFEPAYPGADIDKEEYEKMLKLGIKSEQEYAEYKADPKAWAEKNKTAKGKGPTVPEKTVLKKKTINSNTSFKMNVAGGEDNIDDESKEAYLKGGVQREDDITGKDMALVAGLGAVGIGIAAHQKWKKRQEEKAYRSSFEGSDYEAMEEL